MLENAARKKAGALRKTIQLPNSTPHIVPNSPVAEFPSTRRSGISGTMSGVGLKNYERKRLREECREALKSHIFEKTGLEVQASEVRLKTRPSDPYVWEYPPKMEHLFSRPLSECSVGPLRTLCDGVGRSFEAKSRENEASGGFSSRIEHLSEELESLQFRHAELTRRHDALVERNQVLEVQNEELQKKSVRLENRNGKLERQNERLEAQFNDQSAEVGHLFGYISEFTKGVQSFWPLLGSQDPETGSIGVDEGSGELCNVL